MIYDLTFASFFKNEDTDQSVVLIPSNPKRLTCDDVLLVQNAESDDFRQWCMRVVWSRYPGGPSPFNADIQAVDLLDVKDPQTTASPAPDILANLRALDIRGLNSLENVAIRQAWRAMEAHCGYALRNLSIRGESLGFIDTETVLWACEPFEIADDAIRQIGERELIMVEGWLERLQAEHEALANMDG